MKNTIKLAAVIAALTLPVAAYAVDLDESNLTYTYAEVGFTDRDFDGPSVDGFLLNGSYEITDLIFVYGGYTDLSGDGDTSTLVGGAGISMALTDMIDGYAKAGLISDERGASDDLGLGVEVGVRSMIMDQVEAFGNVQIVDIYNDNDVALEVGGRYWLKSDLGFSASYTSGDFLGSGVTVAARYNF